MSKDKKLKILVGVVIPYAVIVVLLSLIETWTKGLPLKIVPFVYALSFSLWVFLAINRARQISKGRTKAIISINQPKKRLGKRAKAIEGILSLFVMIYEITILVNRLEDGSALYAILAPILIMLISGSHLIFSWFSAE
jgi:hypothetical protein